MAPKVELFSFILGELKTPERHFEIYWPLQRDFLDHPVSRKENWSPCFFKVVVDA